MQGHIVPFPQTYAALDTGRLLQVYQAGPERLRAALDGQSDEVLLARPIAGKWSIQEIAAHVADSDLIGTARLRMVLGGDDPPLPFYNQDRWSRDLKYQGMGRARLDQALALFAALRAVMFPVLAGASVEQWGRRGTHAEFGPVTLRNLLELYADHGERHIAQILERRRMLGAPSDLPLLLPERLY